MKKIKYKKLILLISLIVVWIFISYSSFTKPGFVRQYSFLHSPETVIHSDFFHKLAVEAEDRLKHNVTYDGRYIEISYPMGDVPKNIGVCTDVLIRAYRSVGIDLQEKVHLDIKQNFFSYPKMWRLTSANTNIDHRRVPNLMIFFNRQKASLEISKNKNEYLPGDIVAWDLGGGIMHIGIVSTKLSKNSGNPLIVHNIGSGPQITDMLFQYTIIGHYRYGI